MALTLTNTQNLLNFVNGNVLGAPNGLTSVQIGDRRFLYVSTETSDNLSVYELNSSGIATLVEIITLTDDPATLLLDASISTTHAQVDGTDFLIAVGANSDAMTVFEIGNDGTLEYVSNTVDTGSIYLDNPRMEPVVLEVGGTTYVYATGRDDDGISVFSLSPSGHLSSVQNIGDAVGFALDGAVAMHSVTVGGTTFVLVAAAADDAISVFSVGTDGKLSAVDFVLDSSSASYLMDTAWDVTTAQVNGATYVYVAGRLDDGITIFNMSASGDLTFHSSVADAGTLELDGGLYLDTYDIGGQSYIMASGFDDDGFTLFRVSDTGDLTEIVSITDGTGSAGSLQLNGAGWTELVEIGGVPYLYVSGVFDNGISVFRIDLPIAVEYNGTTYDMAETLAGAMDLVEAGSVVRVTDDALYTEEGEKVVVERDNITVETTASVDAEFHLERFAYNFTVTGDGSVTVVGQGSVGEVIQTDRGDDLVYGYAGDDSVATGYGADSLFGGLGDDTLKGGAGEDRLYGGNNADALYGGGAYDEIFAGRGNDHINAGGGNDGVYGGAGADTVLGGNGDDFLVGEAGEDSINGGSGRDDIYGGDARDILIGGGNGDTLHGNDDADMLFGGSAADTLEGGAGSDGLFGGSGGDDLYGEDGKDSLDGSTGDDNLFGGVGNDTLFGGDGADTLNGDGGNDRLMGGADADVFVFDIGGGTDRVLDFEDNVDELDIDWMGMGFTSSTQMINLAGSESSGNAILDFGLDGKIIIENATLAELFNDVI